LRRRRRWGVLPEAELVAVGITADGEPAHAGDRHAVAGLTAQLADTGAAGVDVVDAEVGTRAALARRHIGDGGARLLADPGHVVLERPGERLELPAEQRAPELAAPPPAVRR